MESHIFTCLFVPYPEVYKLRVIHHSEKQEKKEVCLPSVKWEKCKGTTQCSFVQNNPNTCCLGIIINSAPVDSQKCSSVSDNYVVSQERATGAGVCDKGKQGGWRSSRARLFVKSTSEC